MKKGQVMIIIKYFILLIIFASSSYIGILMSRKYKSRVLELREFKEAMSILENKIKFTYKPLGEIFEDIITLFDKQSGITKIFNSTNENMKKENVSKAWENAVEDSKTFLNLNAEDINIVKGLGKLLR